MPSYKFKPGISLQICLLAGRHDKTRADAKGMPWHARSTQPTVDEQDSSTQRTFVLLGIQVAHHHQVSAVLGRGAFWTAFLLPACFAPSTAACAAMLRKAALKGSQLC